MHVPMLLAHMPDIYGESGRLRAPQMLRGIDAAMT